MLRTTPAHLSFPTVLVQMAAATAGRAWGEAMEWPQSHSHSLSLIWQRCSGPCLPSLSPLLLARRNPSGLQTELSACFLEENGV